MDDERDLEVVQLQPRVYKIRWFIMIVLSQINFTNGLIYISFSSVADSVTKKLNTSLSVFNWSAQVFPLYIIVFGFPTIWLMEKLELRLCLIGCSWLNLLSSFLRYLGLYLKNIYVVLVGQCIGAIAQPLALFSPARLAALWFPPNERPISTTISAMGNMVGLFVALIVPPLLQKFSGANAINDFAIFVLAFGVMGTIMATFGIHRSRPLHPPTPVSDSSAIHCGFWLQVSLCLRSKSFMLLAFSFGIGMAIFTALSALMEQIMCPYGFNDLQAAMCNGLLLGCGFVGALISGVVADRTYALIEIIQICLTLATGGLLAFAMVLQYRLLSVLAVSAACIGAFGVAQYSVSLELAAELVYPVSENVTSGILIWSGQLLSLLLMLLAQASRLPMLDYANNNACSLPKEDQKYGYWVSALIFAGTGVLASSTMLLGFMNKDKKSGLYRRRDMEKAFISEQNDTVNEVSDGNDNGDHKKYPVNAQEDYNYLLDASFAD